MNTQTAHTDETAWSLDRLIGELSIVTLKWGPRYGISEVNRLYDTSRRFGLDGVPFYCFTDDPTGMDSGIITRELPDIDLPELYRWTFWRKICLFGPRFPLTGPCLYFDIDSVIVGPLEPLLRDWRGEPRSIRTFAGPKTIRRGGHDGINSSLMLFQSGAHTDIIDRFYTDLESILRIFPSDQGFIYNCLRHEMT